MSPKLLYYKALEARTKLSNNEKWQLHILQRGFEGECLYDKIFDQIGHENVYIFRDVYLKIESSITQYDSIVISNNRVVVNEIKNFAGDYRYENNNWSKGNKQLPDNAFIQLNRAMSKLKQLSNNSSVNFKVDGDVIFPNDDFRLTSEDHNIWNETVLRNELRTYLRKFKNEHLSDKAKNIAILIRDAIEDNPYFTEKADITKLQRGLYCGECGNFNLIKGRFQLTCGKCGTVESNETHLIRAMSDHKYLFYNQPMSRQSLSHLIDNQLHEITIYRALQKHCYVNQKGNRTTYTLKHYNSETALRETRKIQRYKDKIK